MKATAVPAIEHQSSSTALHAGKQGNTAFFGPAAGNEAPFFAPRIQTKLTIGRPGDKYEQEADAVADRVVQRLANPGPPVAVQKKCQDCEEKEKLQRKEEEEENEAPEVMRKEAEEEEAPPPVQAKEKEEGEKPGLMRQAGPEEEGPLQTKAAPEGAAVPSPGLESRLSSAKGAGAPMDKNTRQPMEAAFGQDFSRVHIHTDSSSAQMNRELNARAFTHGRDIYFNAGEYSPGSTEGRRLLAHELVHVGQQGGGFGIQLKRSTKPQRTDIVVVLSPSLRAEAAVLSAKAKVFIVKSPDDLRKKLSIVNYPIDRLFIISHSLPSGDLGFESGDTTTFVRPSDLASKLTGTVSPANAPNIIDFRGCSIGSSPQGMEKIRAALGAGAVIAGNCFLIAQISGPITIDSRKITQKNQVNKWNRPAFNKGMSKLKDSFGGAKKCILDDSDQAYFQANGKLVAQWASPSYDTQWDRFKSVCQKDLPVEAIDPDQTNDMAPDLAKHCKLIKIEKKP